MGCASCPVSFESSSLSEFAKHTLRQICSQEWVHYRCLQVKLITRIM